MWHLRCGLWRRGRIGRCLLRPGLLLYINLNPLVFAVVFSHDLLILENLLVNGIACAIHMLPVFVLSRHTVVEVAVDHTFLVAVYYRDDPVIEKEVFVEAAVLFVVGFSQRVF
jgi:hypothetical protein